MKSNHVDEWTDLPLWLDSDNFTFDNRKVIKDLKMEVTDFEISVKETIAYYNDLNWKTPTFGMAENRKEDLINKLKLKTNL